MTPIVTLHLVLALVALLLGLVMLLREKGTRSHRALGRVWVGAMLVVAITSFWIRDINDGGMSAIHLLSLWTLVALAVALWAIRTRRRNTHRGFMIGTYLGLVGAGTGTLLPGRIIGEFVRSLV